MIEHPGKRSDFHDLLEQKKQIIKDMVQRTNPHPSLIQTIKQHFDDMIQEKKLRANPPPVREGAEVTGFNQKDTTI